MAHIMGLFVPIALATDVFPRGMKERAIALRDPSIQITPTWGPKDCEYYLHSAIWIPLHPYKLLANITLVGLLESLGLDQRLFCNYI